VGRIHADHGVRVCDGKLVLRVGSGVRAVDGDERVGTGIILRCDALRDAIALGHGDASADE
jgi:hypothetical protein